MEACNGTGAQVWDFAPGSNGDMTIQNSLDFTGSQCLDIHGNSAFSGTTVALTGCNGTTAQAWQPALRTY